MQEAQSLLAEGNTVKIAYGRNSILHEFEEVAYKIGNKADLYWHILESRLFDDTGFASRRATRKFIREVIEYDPDVILLHNIHGYYINIEILFEYIKSANKKVVWTLHDCWAFTGHCSHFSYVSCDKWRTGCNKCPQKKCYPKSIGGDLSRKNYVRKKRLFTGIEDMTIQTPSEWLKQLVVQSFLGEYKVVVVPHTVDEDIFHPVKSDIKSILGIEKKKMILGVASAWQERKGLYDFFALNDMIDDNHVIVLAGLTDKQMEELPSGLIGLPKTYDMKDLAKLYSAADVYVSMSVEETFGLTVLEASKCGTPVVVYENTASEEVAIACGGKVVKRNVKSVWEAVRDFEKQSEY